MLASAPELAEAMPGIYIDAKVSRSMIAGVYDVEQLAAERPAGGSSSSDPGTNGPVTDDQIGQLRRPIGPHAGRY